MTTELQPIQNMGMIDSLKALFGNYDLDLKPLVGRTLETVELSDDKETLTFRFEDGGFVSYGTEGDCCSQSWIEHITVPPDIKGQEVVTFREQVMGEFEEDYNTIKVYQTSFGTAKGEIIVEYRNSSNGYYGGGLRGPVAQEIPDLVA